MKQFEYRILDVRMWHYDAPHSEDMAQKLNEHGLEGFELVAVSKGYAFLKKEAPGLSPAQYRAVLAKRPPGPPPMITVPNNTDVRPGFGPLLPRWPWRRKKRREGRKYDGTIQV